MSNISITQHLPIYVLYRCKSHLGSLFDDHGQTAVHLVLFRQCLSELLGSGEVRVGVRVSIRVGVRVSVGVMVRVRMRVMVKDR